MTREKEIYRTTVLGGVVNVLLLCFKFLAGILSGSAAMIADAVHSLSDFFTDIVVLVFVRISSRPADKGHDYGYGKYETLATTIIGMVLLVVAAGILSKGMENIIYWAKGGTLSHPGVIALYAALASIVLKEGTFRYTVHKSRKLDSQALRANAWHHRSDALSSVGTAVGISGAVFLGDRWAVLDPIASIIVGVFIIKVGVGLLKNGIDDLMEKSLPDDVENEIMAMAVSIDGISDPHKLRTRRIGNQISIELHIRMDGNMTLSDAHAKTTALEKLLRRRFGQGAYVIIHTEPIK